MTTPNQQSAHQTAVIYSKDWGVYLGSAMGLGFWSNLDPVGQPEACVFENEAQAKKIMESWDTPPPDDVRIVTLETINPMYATIPEIIKAGLPAWNPLDDNDGQYETHH